MVMLLMVACYSFTLAQLNVTGTVKDEAGNALIGVSVTVENSAVGASTDVEGKYSISVPGSEGTLIFSYIGYATQEVAVSASNTTVDVVMKEGVSDLDEVVVTGLASSVKRSNLANAVSSIGTKELTGLTVNNTMDAALYGKFTGAEIRSNSGAPGGGMSIRLRGVTSIFGDQQPLFILDGVYLNNSTISLGTNIVSAAAGGGNAATNQDDASNRLADIEPEDIASIEVLKGASAAAIYGARAAGGVVIITTKRGQAGENKVSFSQTLGGKTPIRLLGQRQLDRAGIESNFGADAAAAFDANGITDYEAALYDRTGLLSTSNLTVSGGDDKNKYFLGGTYRTEDGIVENTGYEKLTLRVNTDHKLADWLNIRTSAGYTNSSADRGFFNNGNTNATVGYALAFTAPWEDLSPNAGGVYPAGGAGSNVLETVNLITNNENVNRLIASIGADVQLLQTDNQSLKLNLTGGIDQYSLRTTSLFPRELSFYRAAGTLNGVSISGSTISRNRNMQASLVYSYYMDNGLNLRTQAGVTQFNEGINTVISTATGLNGSFQSSLDQGATQAVEQNRRSAVDKGFFIQEEINYNDQIIATVGVRADKSSNNGDANKVYYYPKANLAVNIHEFDFWNSDVITQLKPRIAYGQSGRFANFGDRFNILSGTVISGSSGLFTTNLRGNSAVEPETQSELEIGADLGFFDGRINLVATYYSKEVDDLLLRQSVPTTTGFTTQVINGGALANQGIELELNAEVVNNDNMSWNTSLRFWRNQSEITRLDIPAFNLGGFAASLGQYRIEEGKSATQIVGTVKASDAATLDPDGDGFAVYGNAEPDFNLSFNNFFTFGPVEFSFVLHLKQGGDGVNLSTLLWDLAGMTWDYDDVTLDPAGAMGNGDYRTSEWFAGNAGPWIEDAGYLRLREVGLFYNIDRSMVNDLADIRVGFSGRNLINVFSYNSYDPEVSNFGNNVLANSIEVTPYPSAKSFNFHLRFGF
jgi:TonB-linked SusC/RagA family outer membrane protein